MVQTMSHPSQRQLTSWTHCMGKSNLPKERIGLLSWMDRMGQLNLQKVRESQSKDKILSQDKTRIISTTRSKSTKRNINLPDITKPLRKRVKIGELNSEKLPITIQEIGSTERGMHNQSLKAISTKYSRKIREVEK